MQTRHIQTDRLNQQVLEAGSGPLVLLIHGFPELGISWRAQVEALAASGYHAVAPDMRGYGGTDKPGETAGYSILDLVGDMVDLVRALGETECVVVGHDWGSAVAWHCALRRRLTASRVQARASQGRQRRFASNDWASPSLLHKHILLTL